METALKSLKCVNGVIGLLFSAIVKMKHMVQRGNLLPYHKFLQYQGAIKDVAFSLVISTVFVSFVYFAVV